MKYLIGTVVFAIMIIVYVFSTGIVKHISFPDAPTDNNVVYDDRENERKMISKLTTLFVH